jgi:hypothetical protein
MMYFDKSVTVLSVLVIEIEAASLARQTAGLAQNRVALSFY